MSKKLLLILLVVMSLIFFGCDKAEDDDNSNKDIPADPVNVTPPNPTKIMFNLPQLFKLRANVLS